LLLKSLGWRYYRTNLCQFSRHVFVTASPSSEPLPTDNAEQHPPLKESEQSLSHRSEYRPDIDGLRAIAVLAVVGFHADIGALRGGFVGVDVFFVISGYLISGIIFRALERETFSFTEFYVRRINRIFPALIVILVATGVLGWIVLVGGEFKNLGKHIFGGAGFVSNVLLWRETGYFQASAKPLLHLWSLAVEEQFYLAWPLCGWLAWRARLPVGRTIAFVFAISFLINLAAVADSRLAAAFYLSVTRFWEILAGALLIHWERRSSQSVGTRAPRRSIRDAVSLFGLTLLMVSLLVFDSTSPWPGLRATVPVLASVCLIGAGRDALVNRRLLSLGGLVAIGLISYPLYLWHWPLIVLGKIALNGPLPPAVMTGVVTASLILAAATYKFVEIPIRFGRHKRRSAAIALPVMAAVGAVGLVIHFEMIVPRLNGALARQIAEAKSDPESPGSYFINGGRQVVVPVIPGDSTRTVVFFGDSHGVQYRPRIVQLSKERGAESPRVLFMTFGGCPPFPGVNRNGVSWDGGAWHCDRFYRAAMERMSRPDVATVVIAAYWDGYFAQFPVFVGPNWSRLFDVRTETGQAILSRFEADILKLTTSGKRVYIVLSNPGAPELDPSRLPERIPGFKLTGDSRLVSRAVLERKSEPIVSRLRAIAIQSRARTINPMDFLCSATICLAYGSDGKPIYSDSHHMTGTFVKTNASFIDEVMAPH
jgi:peptidoglycan/LPS O-acetylase OafA/YrhL